MGTFKSSQGFSIIELMIVLTIFSILAVMAATSYQNYARRSRVGEGLVLAAGAKTAVSEYYASKVRLPADNAEAGIGAAQTIRGNSVDSVTVSQGKIIVRYNHKIGAENILVLSPTMTTGSMLWRCDAAAGTTVPAVLLPTACRV